MPESTGYAVKNNAESTVADNPLTSSATTLNVAAGQGANFPSAFPFLITIWDDVTHPDPTDDPNMEITECSARSSDALTIVRGKEDTSGVEHANGARVAMLITAGIFDDTTYGISIKLNGIEDNATADQTKADIDALGIDHGALDGLTDDDHTQYLLVNATRAMTGILNMGTHKIQDVVDPTLAQDAATKAWCDANFSGGGVTDHGALTGLADDDHEQYLLVDGSRAMTGDLTVPNAHQINVQLIQAVSGYVLDLRNQAGGGGMRIGADVNTIYNNFDMHTNGIINLADPSDAQDAATKAWCETNFNNYSHPGTIQCSAAESGANSDITSLAGLTTPLSVAQGGTGVTGDTYDADKVDGCDAGIGTGNVYKIPLISAYAVFYATDAGNVAYQTCGQSGYLWSSRGSGDSPTWVAPYSHPSIPACQAATSSVDGHATATQISKLDGIEDNATVDQTKADIDALGINAGQVDGCDAGGAGDNVWKVPTDDYYSVFTLDTTPQIVAIDPSTDGYQLTTHYANGLPTWEASSDLIFSDTHCPKCGQEFEDGETLVLYIAGHNEVGDILTIPMHKSCAEAPKKTVTIKRKVMEDRYSFDELTGEPRVRRIRKMQKKPITKKRMKKDVELDGKTGEFWQLEDEKRKKKITAADATEEYEEEIDEQIYEDMDFEI